MSRAPFKQTDLQNDEFYSFGRTAGVYQTNYKSISCFKNPLSGLRQGERVKIPYNEKVTMKNSALELHQLFNDKEGFRSVLTNSIWEFQRMAFTLFLQKRVKWNTKPLTGVELGHPQGFNQFRLEA